VKNKFPIIIILIISLNTFNTKAQNEKGKWKTFKQLSRPEKCWVITHIFVANKAFNVSNYVRKVADSLKNDSVLDGDADGGQVDAFRHSYWMAVLVREIHSKKALKLGIAHEKGNYLDFKKRKKEDGTLPDKIACEMDLWNNNVGINLGEKYKNISLDSLKTIVISEILKGNMKVVFKNKSGESLDEQGNIIPYKEWNGKWENRRVLVNSDYNRSKKVNNEY
jgi:hypothetical protein